MTKYIIVYITFGTIGCYWEHVEDPLGTSSGGSNVGIVAWTKKSNKGCNEWKWVCLDVGGHHQKQKTLMKTKFANKVIFFQKPLK
jgi:hypothetical protein